MDGEGRLRRRRPQRRAAIPSRSARRRRSRRPGRWRKGSTRARIAAPTAIVARFAVRAAEVARHSPHRLGDNRDRDDLQAVQPGGLGEIAQLASRRSRRGSSPAADGVVKPSQAAKAPGRPARRMPRLIPTWLLAGPGRNWQSATMSAKAGSSSHRRRSTNSARK